MLDTRNESLHAGHKLWLSEISMWKDDLTAWRQELKAALEQLQNAEQLFDAHAQALDRHSDQIQQNEHAVRQHECGIAIAERAGAGVEAPEHLDEARRQELLRNAHERLKKYHHGVVARVATLLHDASMPI